MPTKADPRIAALERQVKELRKGLELVFDLAMRGRAFTEAEEKRMKAALAKVGGIKLGDWKCGDYQCTAAGTLYAVGDTSEIAFPSGGVCPSNASLADGSLWKFTGKCHSC